MNRVVEADIRATCKQTSNGWTCDVTVSDAGSTTNHVVTVSGHEMMRYGRSALDVDAVVVDAFRFLLERESKESILGHFALSDIERYFPEYGGS